MDEKYKKATATPYLAWPDARLRATLRSYGVDDKKIVGRDNLLQEVRVWYVEGGNYLTKLYNDAVALAYTGYEQVADALGGFLGVSR